MFYFNKAVSYQAVVTLLLRTVKNLFHYFLLKRLLLLYIADRGCIVLRSVVLQFLETNCNNINLFQIC